MEKVVRKRNKQAAEIKALKPSEEIQEVQAKVDLELLENLYTSFKKTQEEIEDALDDEDEYKAQCEIGTNLFQAYRKIKQKLYSKASESENGRTSSSEGNKEKSKVKLPEISVPPFDGDLEKWTAFKDLYVSVIHKNNNLSKSEKFYYLRSYLKEEAASIIQGFDCNDANYDNAWQLLTERYSNKRLIVQSHLTKLIDQAQTKDDSELQRLIDTTNSAIRAIKALGVEKEELANALIAHIVASKLSRKIKKEWELSLGDTNVIPVYPTLEIFLRKHASAVQSYSQADTNVKTLQPEAAGAKSSTSKNSSNCPKCKKLHTLNKCPIFEAWNMEQRWDFIRSEGLCRNCLRSGHHTLSCKVPYKCKKCQKLHHTSLHMENGQNVSSKPKSNYAKPSSGTAAVAQAGVDDSEKNEKATDEVKSSITAAAQVLCVQHNRQAPVLPTAQAKIKHSNGTYTKVRLVIDSASQYHFVTEDIVRKCKLPFTNFLMNLNGIGGGKSSTTTSKTILEVWSNDLKFKMNIKAHVLVDRLVVQ